MPSSWQPRSDDVFKCLYQILQHSQNCRYLPVEIQSPGVLPVEIQSPSIFPVNVQNCLSLLTIKEVTQLWGDPGLTGAGLCVTPGSTIWSDPVEMENVKDIAFTMQRIPGLSPLAGHCGLDISACLETSPDELNWDTCCYAGFTNLILGATMIGAAGLCGQCTMPVTIGPKYMRARVANESMNDIIIRSWLTLTKTCSA